MGQGENREAATLAMLAKFQSKLTAARTLAGDYDDDDDMAEEDKGAAEEDDDDMSW